jgi:hypothetical protein
VVHEGLELVLAISVQFSIPRLRPEVARIGRVTADAER